jgi:hypothetical protein
MSTPDRCTCTAQGGRKDIKRALYLNEWNVYAPVEINERNQPSGIENFATLNEARTKQESRGGCEKINHTK